MNKIYTVLKGRSFVGMKLILLGIMLAGGMKGRAQVTIVSDGLNNSSSLFTLAGGAYYTGNSAGTDAPSTSPFATEGTHARGISNSSATLTGLSNINTTGYTAVTLSAKLASFSIGGTANGADATDIVTVEISPDGGTTWFSTVRVLGNTNATWAYSTGTGNASTAYDGNTTPVDFQPAAGGARTTDGYSTITVTNLPAISNLRVRFTLFNNSTNERWVIDDFKIQGTVSTPSVNLSLSPSTGTEAAATSLVFTATASAAVTGDQTVNFGLTAGTAGAADFGTIPTSITILSGQTTGTATVNVFNDAVYECTETGTFTISSPSAGLVAGTTLSQIATITDDDLPAVNLSINASSGSEVASTSVTLTATSGAAVIGNQTLSLGVSGTATAADFTGLPASITILSGQTTGTATFTVNNDALFEGTENATFTISAASACIALGTTTSQAFSIADDDNPTVSISVSPASGTEAASTPAVITVTSVSPVTGDQTITVSLSGTATAADLAGATFPATVTILNGQTTGTLNFNVFDDAVTNEGTETATFTLSAPSSGIALGTPVSAGFSIADDDIVPAVAINSINDVVSGTINTGSSNNILYHFSTAITFSAATLNSVTLPVTFTSSADFSAAGFKLWFNASGDNFSTAVQLGTGVDPTGAALIFPSLSQSIAAGSTGYFFITADVSSGATVGNTIIGNTLPLANVVFSTTVSKTGTATDAGLKTIASLPYTAFDNFNRTASYVVGIPSSGGATSWSELQLASGNDAPAQIFNNQLYLTNVDNTGAAVGNGFVSTSFDMSSKYSTIFTNALSDMNWIFNFKSSRAAPSGFGTGNTYAMAFIAGCDQADPTSVTAKGYAVILGNSSSPDPVKLVRFSAGINGTLTDICTSSVTTETNYYSVKLIYTPCNNQWSLQVRDDGSSAFADPTTNTATAVLATDGTHVSVDLKYVICEFKHGSSVGENCKFDNIFIPTNGSTISTYTWNGSTTNYQTATAWTPGRNCPKVTDILVFDATSPATSTVINVPNQTIGKLLVSGSRAVTFKDVASDVAASTLTIGGGTGSDFSVEAGSSFIFDVASSNASADALVVSLSTGATADVSGNIIFRNSNAGTVSRPHEFLAADASAITVNNGGFIKAEDLTGDPFGSTGTANVVNFLSGSVYESGDGGTPFGLTQPASKIIFNTGSFYRHTQATAFSSSGRVYANFEYNVPSGTTGILTGSSAAGITMDNFTVTAGTLNITGATNSLPVNMDVKGNVTVMPGAVFNYDPATASTLSFAATANAQQISNTGTLTLGRNATIAVNNTYPSNPKVDVLTDIKIQGTLSVNTGNLYLSTGNITLQSDATSTANVSAVTGSITYGSGLFFVERFINSNRKWRFLSVNTTTTQSINDAWQEGQAANANGNTGYGVIITDASATAPGVNGFDQSSFAPSMKYFDPAINDYTGVVNTSGNIALHDAYMTYVRGDRTCTPGNSLTATTVLRTKGTLKTGDQTYTVTNAGDFAAIGNPYASRVSISSLQMTGLQDFIYIWDPKIAGAYSLGGFQTLQKVSGVWKFPISLGGSYPSGINVPMDSIESGQAFFVRAQAAGASLTFKESSKAAGSHDVNFTAGQPASLIALLRNAAGEGVDAAMVQYNDQNSNSIDFGDALKMANTSENVSIKSSSLLAIEQRKNAGITDTVHLNVTGYKVGSYQWTFKLMNMDAPGLAVFVKDNFLNTLSPLNMNGDNNTGFTISSAAGSYAADRFSVVFRPASVVAVTLSSIAAQRLTDKSVKVSWRSENEAGTDHYEIQRSENGIAFSSLAAQTATNNAGGTASYSYHDLQPNAGINYYRVKAVSTSGAVSYTAVVKVTPLNEKPSFNVSPNPVKDKLVRLQATAQAPGDYKVQLINNAGQVIYQETITISGTAYVQQIPLPANTAAGNYLFSITDISGKITSDHILIE
jgi:hypothetical protein